MTSPRERLDELLTFCREREASDLHLSTGKKPYYRLHGTLRSLDDQPVLSLGDIEAMARSVTNERRWNAFEANRDLDIAYSPEAGGRYRINVFAQHHGLALSARRLEDRMLSLAEWNLPQELASLTELPDGLVIATGPTGSGKTTTLATLIDGVARNRPCHIITVEDPVEYLYESGASLVHQRELHTHVDSFDGAIRSALREDPDALLVGEMRDLPTLRAGITAAETGHLVFSTLHTGDAVGSIERMVALFPAQEKESVRQQLSMVLRAVIAQKLLVTAEGTGRVPRWSSCGSRRRWRT